MMNHMRNAAIGAVFVAGIVGGSAWAQTAPTTAKCEAGKLKCIAGLAAGNVGCLAKDSGKPNETALQTCLGTVGTKFAGAGVPTKSCFGKLEAKPGCLTTGDSGALQTAVDNFSDALRAKLDPNAPPSTLSKCAAGKQKCVANLVKALLGCEGKNVGKPSAATLTACIQKSVAKFNTAGSGCFQKLEAKVGNDCITTADVDSVQSIVSSFRDQVAVALDCGDGLVSSGEECDDGNRVDGDGCSAQCAQCGNGNIGPGETCDDGNTVGLDDCPANCVEQACDPTATPVTATVSWSAPTAVGGLTVYVDYPEGKVNVPGHGSNVAPGTFTNFPSGTTNSPNVVGNLGNAVRMVVSKATAITPRPGTLFKMNMTTCTGAAPATAGDFTCAVLEAFAPDGSTPVSGATCSVSIP